MYSANSTIDKRNGSSAPVTIQGDGSASGINSLNGGLDLISRYAIFREVIPSQDRSQCAQGRDRHDRLACGELNLRIREHDHTIDGYVRQSQTRQKLA